ncbi:potassium voltage-gated channel subfamily B member 1 [Eurytemora carolleeae]|uniref:potassium voltage-gated channel subfamily B member 1 n=1 Tax=Eurytemora carolleeae TaxID=1294199 RepID=UPI000C789C6F|nr:potassium voltage-gated channel subfamily B member 1 [Eurytemora carolleeae]|eukprot:XP_023320611.1 potassium voltage-gated channel subfamily B member 1-like [Eurytemora affinis]
MTITTVGYDLNPKTLLGKLIGGFCALSGVFILTLPIPIVVNSFASYYKNRLWRNEVEHKKRERTLQIASELRQQQQFSLFQAMAAPGINVVAADNLLSPSPVKNLE